MSVNALPLCCYISGSPDKNYVHILSLKVTFPRSLCGINEWRKAAWIAGQRGLCQSHHIMEIRMCCRAFVGPFCFKQERQVVFRKNVINLRGLVSRRNGGGAEVQSGMSVSFCVCLRGDAPVC